MRIEKDALGELPVPEEAYYGIQTVRCAQNYDVTDHTFNELPHVIRAVAEVKKAAALANKEIKALEAHKADAIFTTSLKTQWKQSKALTMHLSL